MKEDGGKNYIVKMEPADNRWKIGGVLEFKPSTPPGVSQIDSFITPTSGAPPTALVVTITGTDPTHTSKRQFTLKPI